MTVFLWVGATGFALFFLLLVLGAVFDLFGDLDLDQPGPFNVKGLALGLVGFGAFGYAATALGLGGGREWLAAGVGFFFVSITGFLLVVRPMHEWQSNTALSRSSYLGAQGEVTLAIGAGDWGQVTFYDRNNARVTQKAVGANGEALALGTRVLVVDVADDGVVTVIEDPLP